VQVMGRRRVQSGRQNFGFRRKHFGWGKAGEVPVHFLGFRPATERYIERTLLGITFHNAPLLASGLDDAVHDPLPLTNSRPGPG